jgi:D-serine dehydratase
MADTLSVGAALEELLRGPVDPLAKSVPPLRDALALADVGAQGWHALNGDMPLPLLVLKESALAHNLALMAAFCAEHGLDLAPHGKTTMSPQLVGRQLEAGAWGVTVATATQARLYHHFGVSRMILANELVDPAGVRWVAQACRQDPRLQLYCLVDSVAGVDLLDGLLAGSAPPGRLPVLVELGVQGQRAGCRTTAEAEQVAAAVGRSRYLALAGVEGFEGVIGADRSTATVEAVDRYLSWALEVAEALMRRGAVDAADEAVISFGGSAFPDRVAALAGRSWQPPQPTRRILRSGCYLTHDHGLYAGVSPFGDATGVDAARLQPAIEVWGAVLSRPEPGLAIVGMGKRDVAFDAGLPIPIAVRDGSGRLLDAAPAATVLALNDQHAFIGLDPADALAVGQVLGCGISHPCTAFDKWSLVPVVDDDYRVRGAVRTFF